MIAIEDLDMLIEICYKARTGSRGRVRPIPDDYRALEAMPQILAALQELRAMRSGDPDDATFADAVDAGVWEAAGPADGEIARPEYHSEPAKSALTSGRTGEHGYQRGYKPGDLSGEAESFLVRPGDSELSAKQLISPDPVHYRPYKRIAEWLELLAQAWKDAPSTDAESLDPIFDRDVTRLGELIQRLARDARRRADRS